MPRRRERRRGGVRRGLLLPRATAATVRLPTSPLPLRGPQQIHTWLGDAAAAAKYAGLHARSAAAFNALFWQGGGDGPRRHVGYSDWVDTAGIAHRYFYSGEGSGLPPHRRTPPTPSPLPDVQFVAILAGIANASQAAALVSQYDALRTGLLQRWNLSSDRIWAPPSNLVPLVGYADLQRSGQRATYPGWGKGV